MKFTLVRNIYFHSKEDGLIEKYVSKEINSDVNPSIGYQFEDSAWHRDDTPKAEEILIDTETGKCTVILNSKKVATPEDVSRIYDVVVGHHGWKDWFRS